MTKELFLKSKKVVFVLLTILVFIYGVIFLPFLNRIYPNIYVAGIYVGDLDKNHAYEKLKNEIILIDQLEVQLTIGNEKIKVSEVVKNVDFQASIDRAFNYANSGNPFYDLITRINLVIKPKNLSLSTEIDKVKLLETLMIISNKEGEKAINPYFSYTTNEILVNTGKNGIGINAEKAVRDFSETVAFNKESNLMFDMITINSVLKDQEINYANQLAQKLFKKNIKLYYFPHDDLKQVEYLSITDKQLVKIINPRGKIDTDILNQEISLLSKKINRDPQNSSFVVENGKVKEFTPSRDGVIVMEKKLSEAILIELKKLTESEEDFMDIEIPIQKTQAKIKNQDVNNLGIETLLGRGVSYFKGSIANRVFNINHASDKFKGILVAPQEIFSFNSVLGDVSALTGYKSAYVIKDGKTVLGDGGGVCQVSTTLFRAVLSAGLPIIERRPHSYRVGYYEQSFSPGLDATIYYPTTDFKFKNDTPNHILIQPAFDGHNSTLIFEIYGTSDNRVATTTKPIITSSTAPAPDLYIDDPTLPAGTVKQIEHKAYGARVVFDYTVTRNGETINSQKFISNYRPWQAVYLRGTAQ